MRPQLVQIQQPAAAAARIQVRNTQELIGKNLNICSNYIYLDMMHSDAFVQFLSGLIYTLQLI